MKTNRVPAKTNRKKWITLAAALLASGLLICGVSFAVLGFDLRALSTVNFVTSEYEIEAPFENLSLRGTIEDIVFARSEDGTCRVVCYEDEKEPHRARVESDTLVIDSDDAFRVRIGFYLAAPKVTVYLPGEVYGALAIDAHTGNVTVPGDFSFESIRIALTTGDIDLAASAWGDAALGTSTGEIRLRDLSAGGISLRTSTGRTYASGVNCAGRVEAQTDTGLTELSDLTCASLYSTGDTGDLYLSRVVASGEFHAERSTGDVHLDGCDAESIFVETSTGNVTGSLLSDKVFLTETDTGRVSVPKTSTGGRCEITTDTGDIQFSAP